MTHQGKTMHSTIIAGSEDVMPNAVRRVLFLDFDGVLHPATTTPAGRFVHAPMLANCFLQLSCDVVISSSWRHSYSIDELRHFLPDELAHLIVGTTGPAVIGKHARFQEIQAWIARQPSPVDWRALDDCEWEFPTNTSKLFLCNANTGLSRKELLSISSWLNNAATERS